VAAPPRAGLSLPPSSRLNKKWAKDEVHLRKRKPLKLPKIADRKQDGIPGHEPNLWIWYRVPGIPDFMIREERILSAILGSLLFIHSYNKHYYPELFINCVVSSRREFADGAEFKTGGTRSQIPENLGHVPELGARLQIQDLEIQRHS
jgi:hypothetical protein